jgi:hypothetical protein
MGRRFIAGSVKFSRRVSALYLAGVRRLSSGGYYGFGRAGRWFT